MTDWGAVSSWVAAGISVTAFGAGTARALWNRPQVDWALSGEMRWPGAMDDMWLTGSGRISNFGDGNAHRVSVWILRADGYEAQRLATSPFLKPGDSVEFAVGVSAKNWDTAVVWVTWTPPPIRRRQEKVSSRLALAGQLAGVRDFDQRLDAFQKLHALIERNPDS